jgi:predicted RecA/RadA family phage recombinase
MSAIYLGNDDEQVITNGASAVACGAIVRTDAAGSKAGVVSSLQGIAANAQGGVKIRGRFTVVARGADTWAAGDQVLWSFTNSNATNKTANAGASSVALGRAVTAKANGATSCEVELNGGGVDNLS